MHSQYTDVVSRRVNAFRVFIVISNLCIVQIVVLQVYDDIYFPGAALQARKYQTVTILKLLAKIFI